MMTATSGAAGADGAAGAEAEDGSRRDRRGKLNYSLVRDARHCVKGGPDQIRDDGTGGERPKPVIAV
jgi:hypothetical protein